MLETERSKTRMECSFGGDCQFKVVKIKKNYSDNRVDVACECKNCERFVAAHVKEENWPEFAQNSLTDYIAVGQIWANNKDNSEAVIDAIVGGVVEFRWHDQEQGVPIWEFVLDYEYSGQNISSIQPTVKVNDL